jgi:hypothetical protein
MALSMTSDFSSEDIHIVKEFKEMKVWLLESLDGDKLVIKIDAIGSDQIKAGNRVVKIIDPLARVKVLSKMEEEALRQYVRAFLEVSAFYESLGMTNHPLSHTNKQAVENLKEQVENLAKFPEPFVKMQAMTLRNIEKANEERGKGNKQLVRDFVATLTEKNGLETMGKVVAMDMFNDNTDRFYPGGGKQGYKIGPYEFNFKALVNVGNVMIALDDSNAFKVTGLDFLDPQSKMKTYGHSVDNVAGFGTIVNARKRKKFAEDIVYDLELLLHPKKHKWSLKTKLGVSAATRLEKGMVQGMAEIKNGFKKKYPNGMPGSLGQRIAMMP